MIKLAICKIHMIGSPALVLGVGRQYVEGDTSWSKYQMFTFEEYLGGKYDDDEFLAEVVKHAKTKTKFHGSTIHFTNLNKDVPVLQCVHDFSFEDATIVEITLEELSLLNKDLSEDQWEDFDWETWGK